MGINNITSCGGLVKSSLSSILPDNAVRSVAPSCAAPRTGISPACAHGESNPDLRFRNPRKACMCPGSSSVVKINRCAVCQPFCWPGIHLVGAFHARARDMAVMRHPGRHFPWLLVQAIRSIAFASRPTKRARSQKKKDPQKPSRNSRNSETSFGRD